jgi:hypothetical protein
MTVFSAIQKNLTYIKFPWNISVTDVYEAAWGFEADYDKISAKFFVLLL